MSWSRGQTAEASNPKIRFRIAATALPPAYQFPQRAVGRDRVGIGQLFAELIEGGRVEVGVGRAVERLDLHVQKAPV